MTEFETRALPGTSPNTWVDTTELTPRQRIAALEKVRLLLCDLCVEEMHPRDVSAVLAVVNRHIIAQECVKREEKEATEAASVAKATNNELSPPPMRKRKSRSRYVSPEKYVDLLDKIPVAADRLHAAWQAGVVPDFVGRRGRENILRHRDALARGVMKKDEVARLEAWVVAIDNAYARIPKQPSSL
ncbi:MULTISPECIES: hypothetical protein [Methylobacterium]|uniref:Uncharacterized protein n=2 Tax=Methylobacterium TaxID=407 RepID=A0A0C6FBS6_9HYPH|nr:hypothetical protein [Methylobacterium aquaticum]BAQ45918.1 hypothetical protein Maq22A_c13520 [Methylobacterium aquaticum]